MVFNTIRYDELQRAFKTLLKTQISKNPETIRQSTLRIIGAYNGYLYELEAIDKQNPQFHNQINTRLYEINTKLK